MMLFEFWLFQTKSTDGCMNKVCQFCLGVAALISLSRASKDIKMAFEENGSGGNKRKRSIDGLARTPSPDSYPLTPKCPNAASLSSPGAVQRYKKNKNKNSLYIISLLNKIKESKFPR